MATIIYQTNTGSSKAYAEMLSQRLSLPAFPLSEGGKIDEAEEIIFIGWTMAGSVQGLAQLKEKFKNIKCICFVGLKADENTMEEIKAKNNITEPLFFLPGNFHIDELKGMYKMMMSMMIKMLKGKLQDKQEEQRDKILSAFENGIDQVSEEKLQPIIDFLSK